MVFESIRVLILDDSADDAELICDELRRKAVAFTSRRVDTPGDFAAALDGFNPDIVLADCRLRGYEIEDKRGKWFDPQAVDACLRLFREKHFTFEGS